MEIENQTGSTYVTMYCSMCARTEGGRGNKNLVANKWNYKAI